MGCRWVGSRRQSGGREGLGFPGSVSRFNGLGSRWWWWGGGWAGLFLGSEVTPNLRGPCGFEKLGSMLVHRLHFPARVPRHHGGFSWEDGARSHPAPRACPVDWDTLPFLCEVI